MLLLLCLSVLTVVSVLCVELFLVFALSGRSMLVGRWSSRGSVGVFLGIVCSVGRGCLGGLWLGFCGHWLGASCG